MLAALVKAGEAERAGGTWGTSGGSCRCYIPAAPDCTDLSNVASGKRLRMWRAGRRQERAPIRGTAESEEGAGGRRSTCGRTALSQSWGRSGDLVEDELKALLVYHNRVARPVALGY